MIPYPAALDAAAVTQERLDNIHENSLIVGNGDINALLYAQGDGLVLRMTKNDVWDARIDTSQDPPLTTIDINAWKKSASDGSWSSWGKPYPCPRACAQIILGTPEHAVPAWRQIRAEGTSNEWLWQDGRAVMRIEGRAEASCGYVCEPVRFPTTAYPTLRVKLSGTPNAKYYVDVLSSDGGVIFASGWIPSPAVARAIEFALPAGKDAGKLVLYTWTTDGRLAENRFESVTLAGAAGKLDVDLKNVARQAVISTQLDLRRAAAHVRGGTAATVRALAQRNVFLIKSDATASLSPILLAYHPAPEQGETDGVKWLRQQIPGDPDWPGMSYAVALASHGEGKAIAIISSLESKDVVADAVQLARETAGADAVPLIRDHEAVWEKFWSASGLDVDDTDLRNMWYRNLYFYRCVSKPGVVAVGLYAGLVSDNPNWHGGHTINYNAEQTHWSAYVTNHVELADPYERLISGYLPRAQWLAKQTYNCKGAFYPHNLYPFEPPDPEACRSQNHRAHAASPWAHTIGNSGFAAQNLWWHYQYQPDRTYLEQTAYPVLREVALFYADFMDQCRTNASGKIILAPSVSPEHWGWTPNMERNRNVASDLAFVRFTLLAAAQAADILGRDADLAARFRADLTRLPDYPLSKETEPIVVDVEDAPPTNYNIAVPAVPVFPGEQITWFSTDAEKQLFTRTLDRLQWNGYNSSLIMPMARARLSLPEAWQYLKREMLKRSRPNGTITLAAGDGCGHFTEQFAVSAAVSELFLQSVGGVIRVFPAWPKDKDGRFTHLRAQGGFLVTAEQKAGVITQLEIASTVGGPLRLLNPWTGKLTEHATQPGQTLTLASKDAVDAKR
ncbi:MAG: hypothetical protein NTW21_10320 [Verrucomicrobia bacterium]|nr:hypothetical protein [Verrucomicrobiota bacterium]